MGNITDARLVPAQLVEMDLKLACVLIRHHLLSTGSIFSALLWDSKAGVQFTDFMFYAKLSLGKPVNLYTNQTDSYEMCYRQL